MSEQNKPKNDHVIFRSDADFLKSGEAASATECTGLIPSDPKSDAEKAAYEEIIDFSADDAEKKHHADKR